MSQPILIVGGGPAGLVGGPCARRASASAVILVDKADRLGGAPILSGYAQAGALGRVGQGRHRRHGAAGRAATRSSRFISARRSKAFDGAPGDFHGRACRTAPSSRPARRSWHRLHAFRFASTSRNGASAPIPDVVTTTQVEQMILLRQGRALPVRRARAGAGRDPAVRRLARPADRPGVVLEDLLHGLGEPRHGDPRGAAELPRLHLLHGYPHLRPLRGPSTTGRARRNSRSNTSRPASPK